MHNGQSYDYDPSVMMYPHYPHSLPQRQATHSYPQPRLVRPSSEADYLAVSAQVVYIGPAGKIPMVASRVTLVDYRGKIVFDDFVRPTNHVTDYRFEETGLTPMWLATAPPFADVRYRIAGLIQDKTLVGYALEQFLSVMGLKHPANRTRDVALFLPFRKTLRAKQAVPLPQLMQAFMNRRINASFEDPTEQARAALDLYRSVNSTWETMINQNRWPCDLPPTAFADYFT